MWVLHFRDSTLVSGSYEKTIKIWDLQVRYQYEAAQASR